MRLSFTLALRNLLHDRVRFIATMIGIVFSVVLVMVQMGLYLGFGRMVTTMVDHAATDLWVVRSGTKCFEDPSLLDAGILAKVRAVDGVTRATALVIGFANWRLPNGEMTPVFVVGSNPGGAGLEPWNVVDGSIKALATPGAVAIDRSYEQRLGVSGIGAEADLRGQSVHVAAVTDGIRAFTTTPYIFVENARARRYTGVPSDKASYVLVRLAPGIDPDRVRHKLTSEIAGIEVLTPTEFRDRSRSFWLFGTGAGAALFAGALLGLIVGTVIVAQTLYSSTKDHINEFATLRAMGSSNRYIYGVIIYQALFNAVVGFALASVIGMIVVMVTAKGSLPVVITPALIIALMGLTVAMCIASALAAIARVVRIDPVMVFTR